MRHDGNSGWRTSRIASAGSFLGLLLLSAIGGCGPIPLRGNDEPPPAPIDFSRALTLGNIVFDVTNTAGISDGALQDRHGSRDVTAQVFSRVFPGDDGPTRFLLLTSAADKRQTLVLGGTNTQLQWAFDSARDLVYDEDLQARVHEGWRALALLVYSDVLPELEDDYDLTVSGFSLGAALSCIVSQYLLVAGYNVDEVVTFGQPRLTDAAGAAVFADLPLLRFANDGDPFPLVRQSGGEGRQFGPMVVLYDGTDFGYVSAGDSRLEFGAQPFEQFPSDQFSLHAEHLYRARLETKVDEARQVNYGS